MRTVPLKSGDLVENLALVKPDGSVVTFAAFKGKPLLLIFLRHLA